MMENECSCTSVMVNSDTFLGGENADRAVTIPFLVGQIMIYV